MNRRAPATHGREYDPGAGDAERNLWAAVVLRALEDAVWPGAGTESASHRDQARTWFRSGGRDFRLVCDLAGFDPEFIRDRALAMIASPPKKWTREMPAEAKGKS